MANVVVEVLCTIAKGKKLDEIAAITEEFFMLNLDSRDEQLQKKKAQGILLLLNEGIAQYNNPKEPVQKDKNVQGLDIHWDGVSTP